MPASNTYVCTLDPEQVPLLRDRMEPQGWSFDELAHAHWRARMNKTTVVAYRSGKLTVQGRGTGEFVQFLLEPEFLKEARYGYEDVLLEEEAPEMFEPHAGIDESGKGDYFGPLVVAAAYVDPDSARQLVALKVADSKTIKSDRRISDLNGEIRRVTQGRFYVLAIGPEAYNRLYGSFGNVNRLLAWGHAKALENLLERVPDCPRAVSDQFGRKETVRRALQERGRRVVLEQRPKAESDIAVAAGSILARAEYVRRLERLGTGLGTTLPKGAGKAVDRTAADLLAKRGRKALNTVAKMHFRTTGKAMALAGAGPDATGRS